MLSDTKPQIRKEVTGIKAFLNKHAHWVLLSPFIALFFLFIVIPVASAVGLSFTQFNTIGFPKFNGLANYLNILTQDDVFMQNVLPNTVKFALIVGPGGYVLSFILAWLLAQITRVPRTVAAVIIYLPSMTGGVTIATVWGVIFSGDRMGYLNSLLLRFNLVKSPVAWLNSPHLLDIMIIVALWSSMGVGFLAMLSGILNVNEELYEAAYIDGISNRFDEVFYITIPAIKPQMLFGAIMAIVGTFTNSSIGTALSGSNPTPNNYGQLIVNHMEDYGYLRWEMGYAAALSVLLLGIIWAFSKFSYKLFGSSD